MTPSSNHRRRGVVLTAVGFQKLWNAKVIQDGVGMRLSFEALSQRTQLDPRTIAKIVEYRERVDKRSLKLFFTGLGLELSEDDYTHSTITVTAQTDLQEASEVPSFYGRQTELQKLNRRILLERCRLVTILGMGGIGKTALAAKLIEQVLGEFEFIIWKSLLSAPSLQDILLHLIQFLSQHQQLTLPTSEATAIVQVMKLLNQHRCLIVLDNVETLLQSEARAGKYRSGYDNYGELFRQLAETAHQSCVILTCREQPKDLLRLETAGFPLYTLPLSGLSEAAAQELVEAKYQLFGSAADWQCLIRHYGANPLALQIVAPVVQDYLSGNIQNFLCNLGQEKFIFDDIQDLLEQQFNRLSPQEQQVMDWLAINREGVSLSELQADCLADVSLSQLSQILQSLKQRSLVEQTAMAFTLQPVVMEFVSDRLIQQVCQEIKTQCLQRFHSHALMKANAREYIKDEQIRLILQPILNQLLAELESAQNLTQHFKQILGYIQQHIQLQPSYAGGSLLNLLCLMKADLSGYNFSGICIWQADLRSTRLHAVNFAQSNLKSTVFANFLGGVCTTLFSPDNQYIASGDTVGNVHLWNSVTGQLQQMWQAHDTWIRCLIFRGQGRLLYTGSSDATIKLWDVQTGTCLMTLTGHQDEIISMTLSPDEQLLATGSDDGTFRLWDVASGACLLVQQHSSLHSLAFAPDGNLLVVNSNTFTTLWNIKTQQAVGEFPQATSWSLAFNQAKNLLACGGICNIYLWDLRTGQLQQTLEGHQNHVWSVTFSLDGRWLASASWDQTVKLWEVDTGICQRTLQEHTAQVTSVDFSADGNTLMSGSWDQTIRLWDLTTGRSTKVLRGCVGQIFSVAFNADGSKLVCGGFDQTARLWQIDSNQCLQTFNGHEHGVLAVASVVIPDASPTSATELVLTAGMDGTIRYWNPENGVCLQTLKEHEGWIWSLAVSLDGILLFSGSEDRTVKVWDLQTGICLHTLAGHQDAVLSIDYSANSMISQELHQPLIASASRDCTAKLWNIETGRCCKILNLDDWATAVAFHPTGHLLATGTIVLHPILWDVATGERLATLESENDNGVHSLSFSPDGQLLACGSNPIQVWHVPSRRCIQTFYGCQGRVWSVAFSPDGRYLASSSDEETVRLWDVQTGTCLKTMVNPRFYEGLNIAGMTGISNTQKSVLKRLGAVGGWVAPTSAR